MRATERPRETLRTRPGLIRKPRASLFKHPAHSVHAYITSAHNAAAPARRLPHPRRVQSKPRAGATWCNSLHLQNSMLVAASLRVAVKLSPLLLLSAPQSPDSWHDAPANNPPVTASNHIKTTWPRGYFTRQIVECHCESRTSLIKLYPVDASCLQTASWLQEPSAHSKAGA